MAECLLRRQPASIANHVKSRRALIKRYVTWLTTESGWALSKRSAICSGKLCGGFTIFGQCCPVITTHTNNNHRHTYWFKYTTFVLYSHICTYIYCNTFLLPYQFSFWTHAHLLIVSSFHIVYFRKCTTVLPVYSRRQCQLQFLASYQCMKQNDANVSRWNNAKNVVLEVILYRHKKIKRIPTVSEAHTDKCCSAYVQKNK